MATWQFDLYLIPIGRLVRADGGLPARIDVGELRSSDWWLEQSLPADYQARLDVFLPRRPTWTHELIGWGAESSNRVDVFLSEDRVEEVHVRIDAREIDNAFLDGLAGFASDCGAVFVTEEGEVVLPDSAAISKEVENSSARRFAVDPATFVKSLHQKEELP